MGVCISTNTPVIPGTDYIVSPYGADTDTSISGTVTYTQFRSNDPQLSQLNDFISYQNGFEFDGNRMMIVEWYDVAKAHGTAVSFVNCVCECVCILAAKSSAVASTVMYGRVWMVSTYQTCAVLTRFYHFSKYRIFVQPLSFFYWITFSTFPFYIILALLYLFCTLS